MHRELFIILENGQTIPLCHQSVIVLRSGVKDVTNFYNDVRGTDHKERDDNDRRTYSTYYNNERPFDVIILECGVDNTINIHTSTPITIVIIGGVNNVITFISNLNAREQSQVIHIHGVNNVIQDLPNQQRGKLVAEIDIDSYFHQFRKLDIRM